MTVACLGDDPDFWEPDHLSLNKQSLYQKSLSNVRFNKYLTIESLFQLFFCFNNADFDIVRLFVETD